MNKLFLLFFGLHFNTLHWFTNMNNIIVNNEFKIVFYLIYLVSLYLFSSFSLNCILMTFLVRVFSNTSKNHSSLLWSLLNVSYFILLLIVCFFYPCFCVSWNIGYSVNSLHSFQTLVCMQKIVVLSHWWNWDHFSACSSKKDRKRLF